MLGSPRITELKTIGLASLGLRKMICLIRPPEDPHARQRPDSTDDSPSR